MATLVPAQVPQISTCSNISHNVLFSEINFPNNSSEPLLELALLEVEHQLMKEELEILVQNISLENSKGKENKM